MSFDDVVSEAQGAEFRTGLQRRGVSCAAHRNTPFDHRSQGNFIRNVFLCESLPTSPDSGLIPPAGNVTKRILRKP